MLSCNIDNYLIKRQSERHTIMVFISGNKYFFMLLREIWDSALSLYIVSGLYIVLKISSGNPLANKVLIKKKECYINYSSQSTQNPIYSVFH